MYRLLEISVISIVQADLGVNVRRLGLRGHYMMLVTPIQNILHLIV